MKTEKHGKWEMHNLWSEIWQKTLKNMENEKCKLLDLEDGENTEICGILKVYTVGPGIWRETLKTMENEKFTL